MIYELWVGDEIKACTSDHAWLLSDAIPFHRRWSCGLPILITCRKG
jgi:hypothetical protein